MTGSHLLSLAYLLHKVRSMSHPVRIEDMNNNLQVYLEPS